MSYPSIHLFLKFRKKSIGRLWKINHPCSDTEKGTGARWSLATETQLVHNTGFEAAKSYHRSLRHYKVNLSLPE
jgi:hypothetical protein